MGREKEKGHLLVPDAATAQAVSRSPELNPGLPHVWYGLNCLSHHPCLSGFTLALMMETRTGARDWNQVSNLENGCLNQNLNCCVKCLPCLPTYFEYKTALYRMYKAYRLKGLWCELAACFLSVFISHVFSSPAPACRCLWPCLRTQHCSFCSQGPSSKSQDFSFLSGWEVGIWCGG